MRIVLNVLVYLFCLVRNDFGKLKSFFIVVGIDECLNLEVGLGFFGLCNIGID